MVSSIAAGPTLQFNPDHVGAELLQLGHEGLGRHAVQAVAVVLGRHLRDDGQIAQAADGADGGADLVDVAERLEDEEVDAAVHQRARLLAEVLLRFVDAGLAPRLDADAERPDGAGHVRLVARRMPRDLRALRVDGVDAVGQAERAELDAVGAERVGLEHVGAGAHVGLVHLGDEVGLRQVQLVERPVQEDAARIQHRPHGAVADEHAALNRLAEGGSGHCSDCTPPDPRIRDLQASRAWSRIAPRRSPILQRRSWTGGARSVAAGLGMMFI